MEDKHQLCTLGWLACSTRSEKFTKNVDIFHTAPSPIKGERTSLSKLFSDIFKMTCVLFKHTKIKYTRSNASHSQTDHAKAFAFSIAATGNLLELYLTEAPKNSHFPRTSGGGAPMTRFVSSLAASASSCLALRDLWHRVLEEQRLLTLCRQKSNHWWMRGDRPLILPSIFF
jgi:hypothetical protein